MPPRDKLTPTTGQRLWMKLPGKVRAQLPAPSEMDGAVVYLAHVGHRLEDRGGYEAAGKLPELTVFYSQGWRFAYAEPVNGGTGLDVYLWRPTAVEVVS